MHDVHKVIFHLVIKSPVQNFPAQLSGDDCEVSHTSHCNHSNVHVHVVILGQKPER